MTKNRSFPAALAVAAALLLAGAACQTTSTAPATDAAATPAPAAPAESEASPAAEATPVPAAPATSAAAEHIRLQHVLISFAGKVPGKPITRSQDEARALAAEVLDRARKGEDFDALVKTYTDDRAPGIYGLANTGVPPRDGEFSRERMVPAFGEVGFSLAPGEIGMAEYDPVKSPYGWHIIKRLE